ncbi:efflux RND transporter periplasmic adaptor subunit [Myxococcus eversor]|uniref:efflux RND transporter periplasmic adaptor subunit n=1 Tax=Myxococcus eversor TaxID=2709661 RepID=UPI0013D5F67C|nr:HlyD family efflux transporter periplasmic adaptor subunit [Myxococcus eversor]
MSDSPRQIFRQEALDHYNRSEIQGSVLRLTPGWVRATFWAIMVQALVFAIVLGVVAVHDHARGPLLLRIKGQEDVTTTMPGRVSRILVSRGEWVSPGQSLVEFYSGDEEAQREQTLQEFRSRLAAQLLNPQSPSAQESVAGLRAQLDFNEARLSERSLKSPIRGRVQDVRIREGQYLGAGEVVVSVVSDGPVEVWALSLVPGRYRPQLRTGQPFRIELEGFAYQYTDLTVDAVSDELVGPAEVRRYLGPSLADVVTLEGSVVVVESRLPSDSFEVDGHTYHYYTGMPGTAWVRLRARSAWLTLFPILELLWRDLG